VAPRKRPLVGASRKKSIGSTVLPAATQPPRRSWA